MTGVDKKEIDSWIENYDNALKNANERLAPFLTDDVPLTNSQALDLSHLIAKNLIRLGDNENVKSWKK